MKQHIKLKLQKLANTIQLRWKLAPLWVKILDVSCWVGLCLLLGYVL